jgi:hypothetical protein
VVSFRPLPLQSVEVAMGLRGIGAHSLSARTPKLSHSQYCWLVYGYDQKWSDGFRNRAHYERTWKLHRKELLADRRPGSKPIAWWHCEARLPYPGLDDERRYLFAHDLLDAEERAALLADWREAFRRGWDWSDVPSSLWNQWTAEQLARADGILDRDQDPQQPPGNGPPVAPSSIRIAPEKSH